VARDDLPEGVVVRAQDAIARATNRGRALESAP
jgi:hypothetical protein